MDYLRTAIHKLIAEQLQRSPEMGVEAIVRRTIRQLEESSLRLGREDIQQQIERELEEYVKSTSFRGIINPQFLERKFGKKTYFYVIDASNGKYSMLREFMEGWQGEHSRYILLGSYDALVILYGTQEDYRAWNEHIVTRGLPVEALPVEDIPLLKGRKIQYFAESGVDFDADAINALVSNYRDAKYLQERDLLERVGVLCGSALHEDYTHTERVLAFSLVQIGGRGIRTSNAFLEVLLNLVDNVPGIRSIYQCIGKYQFVLELVARSVGELDEITERIQQPPGATYTIETTTFVVSKVDQEVMPSLYLDTTTSSEDILGALTLSLRKLVNEEVTQGSTESMQHFEALSLEHRLFLLQTLIDLQSIELGDIDNRWVEAIQTSKRNFIRGFLRQNRISLEDSVTNLAKAVELATQRAVRHTVDILFYQNYGEAQNDVGLKSTKYGTFTLGNLYHSFLKFNDHPYYRAIGITFSEDFLTRLQLFTDLRNRQTHAGGKEERALISVARDVRQALILGHEVIAWLTQNTLAHKGIPPDKIPALLVLAEQKGSTKELEDIGVKVRQITEDQLPMLMSRLEAHDSAQAESAGLILSELAALATIGSASKRREAHWRKSLDEIRKQQSEIISHTKPAAKDDVTRLFEKLDYIGEGITLNLLANAIWYLIFNVTPAFAPTLISWLK